MNNPLEFYKKELHTYTEKRKKVQQTLLWSSILRFTVFSLTALSVYLFSDQMNRWIPTLLIGFVLLIFLVKRHTQLNFKSEKLKILIEINQTEIRLFNNKAHDLETGSEFLNPHHEYSHDIDLFGKGSFFQFINRTSLLSGKQQLVNVLNSNDIKDILEKQEAIADLSKMPKWRQNFTASARMIKVKTREEVILNWMQNYQSFIPQILQYVPVVFLTLSILLFVLNFMNIIPGSFTVVWFFVGMGITGKFVKKVNKFSNYVNEAKDTFRQYATLLKEIEEASFESSRLKIKQQQLDFNSEKASNIIAKFSKLLDALDQRNNLLFGVLANAFALWDIKYVYKIEKWISLNKSQIEKWFEVVSYFDMKNSLANYRFNHPEQIFPKLTDEKLVIKATDLGHPLIDTTKRIDNDFEITEESFYIITGANMAGKSTFLRTISLSIVMANMGLPVCAKSYEYKPIKLITSMRTSDSLSEDESYFFSELKRLKFVIEGIKEEKHFIVLDEILKGTNSVDKAKGSRKYVERLVKSHSTGIIATHDLSLCEISEELNQVKNYYFDAEIINNELSFDYTLKKGICQNMNASFLLKKMEIV